MLFMGTNFELLVALMQCLLSVNTVQLKTGLLVSNPNNFAISCTNLKNVAEDKVICFLSVAITSTSVCRLLKQTLV